MATFDEPRTETEPAPDAPPEGRLRAPWTKVLGMGLAAFAVWFVLFAPTLQHNAQVSPVGERRTISLDLVGPVAAFSRATAAVAHRLGHRPRGNETGRHGRSLLLRSAG